jgi:serine/threonine protein phosphatase PrpC
MNADNAAVSDVGKVRSSNQDSGYAGTHLLAVADGMGGHAGGDVASHLAIRALLELDRPFDSPQEARGALVKTLLATNDLLVDLVYDHPELAGLGTTVSAIIRVGDKVAIAHIGDSRIYLLRRGELSQVTIDHTFVQRLIDSGRITEEEAKVHPRRSVLMRVLGDVDANPEIDSMIVNTEPGDRWMLCSDGLTGVLARDEIHDLLTADAGAETIARSLLNGSLAGGAPDTVTVVVANVTEGQPEHERAGADITEHRNVDDGGLVNRHVRDDEGDGEEHREHEHGSDLTLGATCRLRVSIGHAQGMGNIGNGGVAEALRSVDVRVVGSEIAHRALIPIQTAAPMRAAKTAVHRNRPSVTGPSRPRDSPPGLGASCNSLT